jgi:triacylglycerol lipase
VHPDADLLARTNGQCGLQTISEDSFHHLSEYIADQDALLAAVGPFLTEQKLGTLRPSVSVFIDQARNDPAIPWATSHQLALGWCAQGADVQFWTNEAPPFANSLDVDHSITYLVDGER